MAPILNAHGLRRRAPNTFGNWRDVDKAEGYIVESWYVSKCSYLCVGPIVRWILGKTPLVRLRTCRSTMHLVSVVLCLANMLLGERVRYE